MLFLNSRKSVKVSFLAFMGFRKFAIIRRVSFKEIHRLFYTPPLHTAVRTVWYTVVQLT